MRDYIFYFSVCLMLAGAAFDYASLFGIGGIILILNQDPDDFTHI